MVKTTATAISKTDDTPHLMVAITEMAYHHQKSVDQLGLATVQIPDYHRDLHPMDRPTMVTEVESVPKDTDQDLATLTGHLGELGLEPLQLTLIFPVTVQKMDAEKTDLPETIDQGMSDLETVVVMTVTTVVMIEKD